MSTMTEFDTLNNVLNTLEARVEARGCAPILPVEVAEWQEGVRSLISLSGWSYDGFLAERLIRMITQEAEG